MAVSLEHGGVQTTDAVHLHRVVHEELFDRQIVTAAKLLHTDHAVAKRASVAAIASELRIGFLLSEYVALGKWPKSALGGSLFYLSCQSSGPLDSLGRGSRCAGYRLLRFVVGWGSHKIACAL
jgi:hypothetical protein